MQSYTKWHALLDLITLKIGILKGVSEWLEISDFGLEKDRSTMGYFDNLDRFVFLFLD
jgi:hypothetical protein